MIHRFLLLLLLAFSMPVHAHDALIPGAIEELELFQVAEDVFAIHGTQQLPDAENLGFISNSGIVVTDAGVLIIDSGGSFAIGEQIIVKLRSITDKPVVAIINTHVHGDHWLGNSAILKAFPEARIYAHPRAIERLNGGEAENWQSIFKDMTSGAVGQDNTALPTVALNHGDQLTIGDRRFALHHTGHAHTDSDLMVEVPDVKTLFTGDVVEHGRAVSSDVPQDFDIAGQIEAIEYLMQLPVDIFVPGHGPTGDLKIPQRSLDFLRILHNAVIELYEEGLQDFEMVEPVKQRLAAFENWFGFDQVGRLVSFVYQQVEAEAF